MRMRYTKRGKAFVLHNAYTHVKTDWVGDLMRRVSQVHRDKAVLPAFARPEIPDNVAPVQKPVKADLQMRFRTRFTR